jgi:hypothetical protein
MIPFEALWIYLICFVSSERSPVCLTDAIIPASILHMGRRTNVTRVFAVLAIAAVYATVVWMGITEERRRSLIISTSSASIDDFVIIDVAVTSIDTARGLLNVRIRLVPMGRFAKDKTTPATDLKLLGNSVSGKQTLVFAKGERIVPIEFSGPLSGNPNRYPFDRYVADIDLLVTAPAKKNAGPVPGDNLEDNADPLATKLIVGASDLYQSETISIKENLTASIPGFKFEGMTHDDTTKLMHAAITIRRANNVVIVSLVVMTVMVGLAVSIMGMVLRLTGASGEINLVPLSLCVALIFGLPALRNMQPGVPAVGVLSDYMSFIWAEFMVATSAIALAWTWIIRSRRNRKSELPPGQ